MPRTTAPKVVLERFDVEQASHAGPPSLGGSLPANRRHPQVTRPRLAGMAAMRACRIGWASSAGNCRMRSVRSTNRFSSPSTTRSRKRVVPGVTARRLRPWAASDLFAEQRLDGAHGAHRDVLRRLVVDLHAIDALGIDALDAERLLRQTLTVMRASPLLGSCRASSTTRPLLEGWRTSTASTRPGLGSGASPRRPASSGGMVTKAPSATWTSSSSPSPDAAEGQALLDHHRGDAPVGRVGDRRPRGRRRAPRRSGPRSRPCAGRARPGWRSSSCCVRRG